jgi:hypothetical protein
MIRLGIQLALRSGREGLVRLAVTTVAVAAGVALLLGVLAEFHAFQAQSSRPCWSCTQGQPATATPPGDAPKSADLWNDSVDFYQGQTIARLDIAALGPGAPLPPGIAEVPPPGTYDASPALEALLKTVPRDELGDRFPGRLAGTIGDQALSGPNELVVYVGYAPKALAGIKGTQVVTSIGTAPAAAVFTPFFRYLFAVGVIAVLFPILVLISTATRLAADRREERFAALRLVGGTPSDIGQMAAVEAMFSGLAGTVIGTLLFLAVRPLIDGADIIAPYFPDQVMPAWWEFLAMLIGVPVLASVAALISLRRVTISPLGVARRATPKPPTAWRLATLVAGLALLGYGLSVTSHNGIGITVYPGLIAIMIGLVIAGPWLTQQAARVLSWASGGPAGLLATKRIADNPRAAFRAVTGLVLAVFLGTAVGALVPAVNAAEAAPTAGPLKNVLLDTFASPSAFNQHCHQGGVITTCSYSSGSAGGTPPALLGLPPASGQALISGLSQVAGATAYPLYTLPQVAKPGFSGSEIAVVSCATLRAIPALGSCPAGAQAVRVDDYATVYSDNPSGSTKPVASASSTPYAGSLSSLALQAVLVTTTSPAALERARTYLALNAPPDVSAGAGQAPTPPRTYGEAIAIRAGRADLTEKLVYTAVAITLIVAGCSLAVAAGGGLVDRKRPFTLLRVSGTPLSVLVRVVLFEAAVPLVASTVAAAGLAYAISAGAFVKLAQAGAPVPGLGGDYFLLMSAGLIIATFPLLRRMTAPSGIRFE